MAAYSLELAQDAAYQSYTSRLTELWSLPKLAQQLNTYNKKNTGKTKKYIRQYTK
jgi:hypothetical protein